MYEGGLFVRVDIGVVQAVGGRARQLAQCAARGGGGPARPPRSPRRAPAHQYTTQAAPRRAPLHGTHALKHTLYTLHTVCTVHTFFEGGNIIKPFFPTLVKLDVRKCQRL